MAAAARARGSLTGRTVAAGCHGGGWLPVGPGRARRFKCRPLLFLPGPRPPARRGAGARRRAQATTVTARSRPGESPAGSRCPAPGRRPRQRAARPRVVATSTRSCPAGRAFITVGCRVQRPRRDPRPGVDRRSPAPGPRLRVSRTRPAAASARRPPSVPRVAALPRK